MLNFTSPEKNPAPIQQHADRTPEPVSTIVEKRKYLASTGIQTPDRSLVTIPATVTGLAIFGI